MGKSIAIIQTSAVSSAELTGLCHEMMPEVKVHEIIDSSLLAQFVEAGHVTKPVIRRLCTYFRFAEEELGVDAILNQCSSVSEVVDIARQMVDVPIQKSRFDGQENRCCRNGRQHDGPLEPLG